MVLDYSKDLMEITNQIKVSIEFSIKTLEFVLKACKILILSVQQGRFLIQIEELFTLPKTSML